MKVKFEKKSYYIRMYKNLEIVDGEVGVIFGKEVGIHRREHQGSKNRKYDFVLSDLSTGFSIIVRARKGQILKEIDNDEPWLRHYRNTLKKPGYQIYVDAFKFLENGGEYV